jgi:4-amino-4-deoxy-L-arabinose transferase-like glycosyltransferase
LYYAVTGGLARIVEMAPGNTLRAADMQGWFFRLLSVLMVAPLPLIIWAIARRLRLPDAVGVAAAILPLGIPQFTHIMASANNDALIVPTVSLAVLTIIPLIQGDLSRRKALLAGGAVGLALFTKGMTVLLPFWGLAAIAWGAWSTRRAWRPAGLRTGLLRLARAWGAYTAAVLACGGWWWVRNIVVFGHFAPTVDIERFHEKPGFTPDPREWISFWFSRMDESFWGRFGYGHVVLDAHWIYVATAICVVGLVLAFRPRAADEPVAGRLLILAVWPLLGVPPATRGYSVYAMSGAMPGMQGRYWFGAIAPIAILVALGLYSVLGRYARYLPLAVAIGVVAIQVNAVASILNFFWGSRHASLADRWGALLAWSPLPSPLVLAGVVVGAATLAAGLWRVAATARADGALA